LAESEIPDFRVGIGLDSHGLAEGRPLVLGGVELPHPRGLAGHSDGDVLVHSIMDALLGAANLGDKGVHFPSSDVQYRGISSLVLLARVAELLRASGWRISNVDATILAQKPLMGPSLPEMQRQIGATLALETDRVSIKVTTTDYLGFVGREEGIAACAIATVVRT
jgi:2-C-methyl-D-erythritol 2,4-cyclodiphosphate synthase